MMRLTLLLLLVITPATLLQAQPAKPHTALTYRLLMKAKAQQARRDLQALQHTLLLERQYLKARASQLLRNDRNRGCHLYHQPDINNMVCIPYCMVDGTQIAAADNDFALIHPWQDTSRYTYQVQHLNNRFYVVPRYLPGRPHIDSEVYFCQNDTTGTSGDVLALMARYALTQAPQCFALCIRAYRPDIAGYLIICYLQKSTLWVLSFNGWKSNNQINIGRYQGLQNYIGAKYGSMQNFLTALQGDSLRRAQGREGEEF